MTPDLESQNKIEPNISAAVDRQSSNWDLRNAPKNYAVLMVSQFGSAGLSFVAVWIATRQLGKDGYGGLAALIAVSQIAQIALMWTCTALARYGVQEFVETSRITKTFWARTLIFLPNLFAVLLLSSIWMPPLGELFKLPSESYNYVILHLTALAVSMHVQFAIQAVKMPRFQGYLLLFERAVTIVVLLVLESFGGLNFVTALWAYIVPLVLSAFVGMIGIGRFIDLRPSFDWAAIKEILVFSLPLPIYSLLSYFSLSYLNAVFIIRYMTVADLGIYTVAYQINGLLMQLPTLAGSLLMPLFVTFQTKEGAAEKQRKFFLEILPVLTLGFGAFSLAVAGFFYFALPLIFGTAFAPAANLMWVFAAASTLTVPIATGFLPLSNSTSRTQVQMYVALVAAISNVGLNALLIPPYGLIGCVWATIGSLAASMFVFALMFGRQLQLPIATSVLAVLPTIAAAGVFTFSEDILMTAAASILTLVVVVAVRRDIFVYGIKRLRGFRHWGAAG